MFARVVQGWRPLLHAGGRLSCSQPPWRTYVRSMGLLAHGVGWCSIFKACSGRQPCSGGCKLCSGRQPCRGAGHAAGAGRQPYSGCKPCSACRPCSGVQAMQRGASHAAGAGHAADTGHAAGADHAADGPAGCMCLHGDWLAHDVKDTLPGTSFSCVLLGCFRRCVQLQQGSRGGGGWCWAHGWVCMQTMQQGSSVGSMTDSACVGFGIMAYSLCMCLRRCMSVLHVSQAINAWALISCVFVNPC